MTEERDIRIYLEDVLENLRYAREFTAGLSSAEDLAADREKTYAVVRALEIVGEATKKIPRPVRDRAPAVPWAAMARMRDRFIHGYRQVDVQLVWRTATVATIEVEEAVERLLADLEAETA